MEHWSNKYIGIKYKWGSTDLAVGSDCVRLAEAIYLNEMNFKVIKDGESVDRNWYENNPQRLIREAVKNGEIITDKENLKGFDAVFFKINGIVSHLGVMINNKGKFVHQLNDMTSRLDDVNARHWSKRFFCGVRPIKND